MYTHYCGTIRLLCARLLQLFFSQCSGYNHSNASYDKNLCLCPAKLFATYELITMHIFKEETLTNVNFREVRQEQINSNWISVVKFPFFYTKEVFISFPSGIDKVCLVLSWNQQNQQNAVITNYYKWRSH